MGNIDSFIHPYIKLMESFEDSKKTRKTVILSGESGIGKSYQTKLFLNAIEEEAYIVNLVGYPLEQGAFNTINSAIYKHITNRAVNFEIIFNLLQKVTFAIPRFGQYVSPLFDSNTKFTAFWNLLKKSGISSNEPNIYSIKVFFENLSKGKPIVFYCDNIQWFDKESWILLTNLIVSISDKQWFFVINYTTNAEITKLTHGEIHKTFEKIQESTEHDILHLKIDRCNIERLSELCSSILNARVELSQLELNLLYEYTKGLPLFVKIVLTLFKENGYITYRESKWISQGNWKSNLIKKILSDSIKERIETIYKNIPHSRETLEFASVFGEKFKEELLNELFKTKDSFEILSDIENRFKLIQYLTNERTWMFEHFIIQNYIYNSLGENAKQIHLKIAEYLETTQSKNYLQISLHFLYADEYEKSIHYKILEIKQLIETGCYNPALKLMDSVEADPTRLIHLDKQKRIEFNLLKARLMFHIVQYQTAIGIFLTILRENGDDLVSATCYWWLGRCHIKLHTQEDFQQGLDYLFKAEKIFKKIKRYDELGYVYSDIVVTFAHLNKIPEAEEAFRKSESNFNITKNLVGMLKLQRRNVIFMENRLSAPLLEQTAKTFGQMNLLHEKIMSANNAATQYIYCGELDKAKLILNEANDDSEEIGGFGQAYLYNNLGLLNYIFNDLDSAYHCFQIARNSKFRFVEQLIVDINESVLLVKQNGCKTIESIFNQIYRKALSVGENDYVVPATINYGKCLSLLGQYDKAWTLLYSLEDNIIALNSDYELYMWYSTMSNLFPLLGKINELNEFNEKYVNKINGLPLNNELYKSDFTLITMQFWSDN